MLVAELEDELGQDGDPELGGVADGVWGELFEETGLVVGIWG